MNPINSVAGALPSRVWAIHEARGEDYRATLEGIDLSIAQQAHTAFSSSRSQREGKPYEVRDGIAVFSMEGPLTKAPTCMGWMMGGTATAEMRRAVRLAASDPDVKGMLMVSDSPGGEVIGTEALARDFYDAGKAKPTMTYVEGQMGSAAAWIGMQANEVWVDPTAEVGSIGVYALARDVSEAEARLGRKTTVIRSTPLKGGGAGGSAIEEHHIAAAQAEVDDIHGEFVKAVARGRGITVERAAEMADARSFIGARAVEAGMADRVGTIDEAISALRERAGKTGVSVSVTTRPTGAATSGKKTMNLKELFAKVRGNTEAAEALGVDAAALDALEAEASQDNPPVAATPPTNPYAADFERMRAQSDQIAAQNAAILGMRAEEAAEKFAEDAFDAKKLDRVEVPTYKALFLNALKADGGGIAAVDPTGKLVEGTNASALREAMSLRRASNFHEPEIPSEPSQVASKQDLDTALASTPLGRRAAALKKENAK